MKAILCTHFGTADDLVLADIPEPDPAPGEVLAKVAAVGLNFFDTLIIAGKYQKKPPFPFSPGGEFAGIVERVGAGVTGFAPGDRVLGYSTFGAARERIAVAADNLAKLEADLDPTARPASPSPMARATTRSPTARISRPARPSPYWALPAALASRQSSSAS